FDRNRHRLKVPVAIGVGATFEFMAGTIARAPKWMQQTGLKWLFRFAQEPRRLWKRYLVDFVKFGLLIWPSVFCHWREKLFGLFSKGTPNTLHAIQDFLQPSGKPHKHVFLPQRLILSEIQAIDNELASLPGPPSMLVFDFSGIRSFSADGIGTLVRFWQRLKTEDLPIAATGLSSRVRRLLTVN
ncbi:MAG: hypothetical protein GY765_28615, partial [bacterium]|nr:hypothetical protein [bacterium]